MATAPGPRVHLIRQWLMALLLSGTALVTGLWMLAARFTSNYVPNFRITAADFATFDFGMPGRTIVPTGFGPDPVEQNIIMCRILDDEWKERRVFVRLVHGYNMHDCMRIKGYNVALLSDQTLSSTNLQPAYPNAPFRLQTWALSSPAGDRSVWASIMIQSSDFSPSMLETRSMAFPKASIPDDPNWVPRGLTRSSLKHPLQEFSTLIRAEWNKARNDVLTFLRLKTPVQSSDEMLTVIGYCDLPPSVVSDAGGSETLTAAARATEVALELIRQLQHWHGQTTLTSPHE